MILIDIVILMREQMLFEPPFTNIQDQGLFGVFEEANVAKVIKLLDRVNRNALPVDDDLSSDIG